MRPIQHPLTVFLIGATGDLAKKKIFKALYQLAEEHLLPDQFTLVGIARRQLSREEFHQYIEKIVEPKDMSFWHRFCEHIFYVSGDVSQKETFDKLGEFHQDLLPACGNHLWYVATLPSLYLDVIRHLKATGFNHSKCGWTKILLEKPFGTDLETSRALNHELHQNFDAEQVYQVDHFLGKETVQNLLVFRFANGIFENLWSKQFIDNIQITGAETLGVTGREAFYDETGTVRDVVQNHVLQMMAMTLMEQPADLSATAVRRERHNILASLEPLTPQTLASSVKLGQYTAGKIDGHEVHGYLQERGIPENSKTETAAAIRCYVNNERWQGVPIYLRAGKRLAADVTEISVQFKEPQNSMFKGMHAKQQANVLTLRIGPNEGVVVRLHVKKPGIELALQEVPMQFLYQNEFQMGLIEAYVKLIYDAVQGDTSLFPEPDEIDLAWQYVQPIINAKEKGVLLPEPYAAGSWGPKSFAALAEEKGSHWIDPSPEVVEKR